MTDFHPSPELEETIRKVMSVPDADPAFVRRFRAELIGRSLKSKPRWAFRPVWAVAFVLALAVLILTMPTVAAAIGRLLGYVRGVGLVENSGNLRMRAGPVSVQREGVTLTITTGFVYSDHVEPAYRVDGVSPENDGTQAADASQNP